MKKPWFKDGINFACQKCGRCCSGAPGYVWLSLKDREKIAKFLSLSIEEFLKKYCRTFRGKWSLIEKSNFDCIFLKDKRCLIYKARPVQCTTYPWWPNLLASEASWIEEGDRCKGMKEETKVVDYQTILEQVNAQLKNL